MDSVSDLYSLHVVDISAYTDLPLLRFMEGSEALETFASVLKRPNLPGSSFRPHEHDCRI